MKKKFLIPILGMFVFAMVFSFSNNANSSNDGIASLFVESDNIAYAENIGAHCTYSTGNYCIINGIIKTNAKVCGH